MKFPRTPAIAQRRLRVPVAFVLLAATALFGASFLSSANAADPDIQLGTAASFSVLAGSGITNTGATTVEGNIGSYETPSVTGVADITFITGSNHAGDGVTQQAKSDLLTAYNTAAGAGPPTAIPAELTRIEPYLPGVYHASSSMLLTGAMTLDGGGRSDGVFVFQAPSSLTTATNSSVLFVNGAQPCNVYWQVGSSATFGTGTSFVGNVLALTSITANTNAVFEGRLLANNGAVTLDTNTISAPGCDVESGGGTDTDAGTDVAGTAAAGTDSGTDVSGTDSGTDVTGTDSGTDVTGTDSGTDTDSIDSGTDVAGTESAADSGIDSGTDVAGTESGTDSGTDVTGTDTGTDTDSDTPRLPDTGGSPLSLLGVGIVLALTGTAITMAARQRRHAPRH
jgi:hypothetical protein